jgi:hypothetical protein
LPRAENIIRTDFSANATAKKRSLQNFLSVRGADERELNRWFRVDKSGPK